MGFGGDPVLCETCIAIRRLHPEEQVNTMGTSPEPEAQKAYSGKLEVPMTTAECRLRRLKEHCIAEIDTLLPSQAYEERDAAFSTVRSMILFIKAGITRN